jgi:dihydrofolate reductase
MNDGANHSNKISRVEWNNSVLLHEIDPEEITKMKQEPGRDMVIYGSASIVQTLTNLRLIDRYQLLVFPVVLGSGKPLFHNILHKVKLSLLSNKTYPSGVVELAYESVIH